MRRSQAPIALKLPNPKGTTDSSETKASEDAWRRELNLFMVGLSVMVAKLRTDKLFLLVGQPGSLFKWFFGFWRISLRRYPKCLSSRGWMFLALRADHVLNNSSQGILVLTYPLPICALLEMDLGSSWELESIFSQGTWCSV